MNDRTDRSSFIDDLERSPVRRSSGIPLYLQVAGAIETSLRSNPPTVGLPLPAENELARVLRVSRPTLRQAVQHLAQQGMLYTQRGVGTFPAPQALTRPLRIGSLFDDLQERGMTPTTTVLSIEESRADDVTATELHRNVGERMLSIERVRLAAGRPVALIHNLVALAPNESLTAVELAAHGLYELLLTKFGIELVMGTQRLSAKLATPREAELLHTVLPAALLRADRLTFDASGRGVEKSSTLYLDTTEISSTNLGRHF